MSYSATEGTVVVLEAESEIGGAIVEAATKARVPVVAVSLDCQALRRLREDFPFDDFTFLPGSIVDEKSVRWLAEDLRRLAVPLAGVFAPLAEVEARDAAPATMDGTKVYPHVALARAVAPLLNREARQGSYTVVIEGSKSPGSEPNDRQAQRLHTLNSSLKALRRQFRSTQSSCQLQVLKVPALVRTSDDALIGWRIAVGDCVMAFMHRCLGEAAPNSAIGAVAEAPDR